MLPRRGILAGALFGLLAVAIADDSRQTSLDKEASSDIEEFNKLLEQVDPDSLHAALHDYSPKKFKHGMFKEDRTAVEAIHREQPSVASTIVAKAKRQDIPTNGTTPATTPPADDPSPTIEEPEGPSNTGPAPENPSDTEDDPESPIDAGPSPNPSAVATPAPVGPAEGSTLTDPSDAPTETVGGSPDQPPATITSTNVSPDAPESEDNSQPTSDEDQGDSPTSSSGPFTGGSTPSLTAGQVITTTNAEGITIISTVGGGYVTLSRSSGEDPDVTATSGSTRTARRSSSTSVVLQTTTLPDGSQSTVTAVTVVPGSGDASATPTGEAGAGEQSSSEGPDASLQSGVGAVRLGNMGWEIVCLFGGAFGVAMMM
ncbi:MAG: hypothetical protein LQ337_008170 [Flavoplaca oasis]|nr:MAG: hypothetical protein LQ337_008170 [Flavoplaca oasis]